MIRVSGAAPIEGLDHLVISVPDLDHACGQWSGLGFTLSPRGFHSDELGTANHTIMLGRDYIELFGVARPTPYNAGTRQFLAGGSGVEAFAMASSDAGAAADAMRVQGYTPVGPGVFDRAVARADGKKGTASFGIVRWPAEVKVAGIGLFVCQHLAPDWVWLPELTEHGNQAIGVATIYVAAADPVREAAALAHLAGGEVSRPQASDIVQVAGPDGRATMLFATRAHWDRHFSGETLAGAREEGVVALDIRTRNLPAARVQAGLGDAERRLPARRCAGLSLGFVA